ncbi:hypothetical protein HID58_095308 [Brassica napus]|uniref:Uncharacterized protein n=1 Tax=Brassica napus TaxID=3708 RepID=A0ABQ7X440_BRANA|nr:hypothetical protein HID58_095308 [Brassica napus]
MNCTLVSFLFCTKKRKLREDDGDFNLKQPFVPLKKRKRPVDDTTDNVLAVATKKIALLGNSKYKGVVEHHRNGHWGAQIYIDHKRIWLGTFKSSVEAAMAYDSASIKLRSFDATCHRKLPFEYFHGSRAELSKRLHNGSCVGDDQRRTSPGDQDSTKYRLTCTELFRKGLTPSDVGKLNRLVIPKRHAVKYLPFINEREEGEIVEDVEVVFFDKTMRQWKFRYCYWTSSQSFVFTSGWKRFVKEKNLKERDVIVFYRCDLVGQSKNFLMIHVQYSSEGEVKQRTSLTLS